MQIKLFTAKKIYKNCIKIRNWFVAVAFRSEEEFFLFRPEFFFFRPEDHSDKPNAKQWSRSMWEEVLLLLVPFQSQVFDIFLDLVIFAYFNAIFFLQ